MLSGIAPCPDSAGNKFHIFWRFFRFPEKEQPFVVRVFTSSDTSQTSCGLYDMRRRGAARYGRGHEHNNPSKYPVFRGDGKNCFFGESFIHSGAD